MFDASAAAAAVAAPPDAPAIQAVVHEQVRPTPKPVMFSTVKREITLSEETDEMLTRCVATFQRATRTKMTTSHLVRALLIALGRAFPSVEYEAKRLGPLKLPGNAANAAARRAEFELKIAEALAAALRLPRP